MPITAEAPRGGVIEYLSDASHVFLLRMCEIERFEAKHRGIFEAWESFFGRGAKASSAEVRDLCALGLVGGGLKDHEADELIAAQDPSALMHLYQIAQATLGVAFMPDVAEDEPKKKDDLVDV